MSKNGDKTRIGLLRRLARDERLHPNRRLLAVLMLAVLEGHDYCREILKEQYGNSSKVRWSESTNEYKETPNEDKVNQDAKNELKRLFETIDGGNDGEPTSNSSNTAGN